MTWTARQGLFGKPWGCRAVRGEAWRQKRNVGGTLKLQSHEAQTKFAVRVSRFVRKGYSICRGLDSLPTRTQCNGVSLRIFPKLASGPVWDVSAPHREWGQKANPKIPARPDWLHTLISFHSRAKCAFLTPLFPQNRNKEQKIRTAQPCHFQT